MENSKLSSGKKTYYISIGILAGMFFIFRICILGQLHTYPLLPHIL